MTESISETVNNLQPKIVIPSDQHQILATIARNTAAMLGVQILIKVISFIFGVYVVRRLGAAEFGRYSAAMAYAFILATLTELGTSTLSIREMARKPENISWMVPNVAAIRAILSIVMIIGVTLSARILGKTPDMILGIFIASIGLLLYAFQGPLDSILISKERLDFSSVFTLFNQVTFILLGSVALIIGAGYIGLLIASLVGIMVMGLSGAYTVRRKLALNFVRPDSRRWWSLLKASFPFGVIGIVNEFAQRFDTVFMSFILTYAAVGYFNVSLDLPLATMLVAQSLGLAMFPTMVREYNSGLGSIQNTVQRAIRFLLIISLPIAIGGMFLAYRLIPLIYGQSYLQAAPVFSVVVWALPFMFLSEVLGRACIAMHLENKTAKYIVINSIFSIGLTIALIPKFGVMGAAAAMVIGRFTNALFAIIILKPGLVFKGNILPMLRVILAGVLMSAFLWFLRDASYWTLLDGKIALLFTVMLGALVYGVSVLLFGAITLGEIRFVSEILKNRFIAMISRRS